MVYQAVLYISFVVIWRERFFLGLVFVVTMTRAINRCGCSDWFVQFQQNRKSIYVFNAINILPIHFHIKRWQTKRWAYVQHNYERNSICIFKRYGDKCIPLNIKTWNFQTFSGNEYHDIIYINRINFPLDWFYYIACHKYQLPRRYINITIHFSGDSIKARETLELRYIHLSTFRGGLM